MSLQLAYTHVQCLLLHYTGPAADELDIFLGGRIGGMQVSVSIHDCKTTKSLSSLLPSVATCFEFVEEPCPPFSHRCTLPPAPPTLHRNLAPANPWVRRRSVCARHTRQIPGLVCEKGDICQRYLGVVHKTKASSTGVRRPHSRPSPRVTALQRRTS